MAIKMTMADGTTIEGTAEELAKLQELAGIVEEGSTESEDIAEITKIKRPAEVGEKIVITDASPTVGQYYEKGDVLVVKEADVISRGDIYAEGVDRYIDYLEYHVIEPAEAFDKPAQVGDTILITNAYHTGGLYSDGDKLTVKSVNSVDDVRGVEEFADRTHIADDEYEIIGRKEVNNGKNFEVGDKVKLVIPEGETPKHTWGSVRNGDVGTVVAIEGDGDVRVNFPEQSYWRALPSELTLVTAKSDDELESLVGKFAVFSDTKGADLTVGKAYEIVGVEDGFCEGEKGFVVIDEKGDEQFAYTEGRESGFTYEIYGEKPADEPSIKVGDYAKVIGKTFSNDITEGTIVEVTQEADFEGDYRIDLIDGSDYDFTKPESLEKIEISESDLVFIENGREPGEYKKGDIVVYDDPAWFRNSGIGEVIGFSGDTRFPRVRAIDYEGDVVTYYLDYEIKPISFVEKRADKID